LSDVLGSTFSVSRLRDDYLSNIDIETPLNTNSCGSLLDEWTICFALSHRISQTKLHESGR